MSKRAQWFGADPSAAWRRSAGGRVRSPCCLLEGEIRPMRLPIRSRHGAHANTPRDKRSPVPTTTSTARRSSRLTLKSLSRYRYTDTLLLLTVSHFPTFQRQSIHNHPTATCDRSQYTHPHTPLTQSIPPPCQATSPPPATAKTTCASTKSSATPTKPKM